MVKYGNIGLDEFIIETNKSGKAVGVTVPMFRAETWRRAR